VDGVERTPAAWLRRQAQTLENIILDDEPRVSVTGPVEKICCVCEQDENKVWKWQRSDT